ncbi:MAG: DegV family protein [Intestinibacter sp.]|uniref:DegV family protein n=1 Tax=Intestinibacter sp. TaxID=1965304 RepID=UPI003F13DB32
MKTAIVTDSNSGIFEKEGQEIGVYIVPMPVIIDNKTYYEGVNLTQEDFYQSLINNKKVFTSQPSPGDIITKWDDVFDKGYDEIVYIPMSSGLSNSCQTAKLIAQNYNDKVYVVDNHRISVTQRHSVIDAVKMVNQGYSAKKIKEILEKTAYNSIIYVGVETLEYLKRGGRVTPAGAAIGSMLDIKPLLVIKGERLDAFAKVRGTKKCQKRLIEEMKNVVKKCHQNDIKIHIGIASSILNEKKSLEWQNMVQKAFVDEKINYDPITFSIGCHIGPGAFGIGISTVN